jgi:2-methylaconitate cis-trans-isomerase PrpF
MFEGVRGGTSKGGYFLAQDLPVDLAARVRITGVKVTYIGDAQIDGVPGMASPIPVVFRGTPGSSCGAALKPG